MKRFLLATVSMVALTSVTRAADMPAAMPAKGPMYSPVPVATWDGAYVGVQGGVVRQDGILKNVGQDFVNADNQTGGAIGALAGYNWQHDNFVYGLEGDWNWIGAKATHFNPTGNSTSYEINWLSTLRARAGFAVDSTLFYLTGGAAFGHVNDNFASLLGQTSSLYSFAQNRTKIGWVMGAGVEYLFAPQWSARAELRYVDLGNTSITCASGTRSCTDFRFSSGDFSNTLWMGLVGVNYKFGGNRAGDWSQARAYAPGSVPVWGGGYLGVQGGCCWPQRIVQRSRWFCNCFHQFLRPAKGGRNDRWIAWL